MRQALVVRCCSRFSLCCAVLLIGSAAFAQRPKVLAPHVPVAPKLAKRHPLGPSVLQSAVGGLWMTGPQHEIIPVPHEQPKNRPAHD